MSTELLPFLSHVFFEKFLMLTQYQTLLSFTLLIAAFYGLFVLQKRSVTFSTRMLIALFLGASLGVGVQWFAGFPEEAATWMTETATWYGLFGRLFVAFIRMLVIPLIFVSILKVVLDFSGKANLSKVATRGVLWLLGTTAIAALIGIFLANFFELGTSVLVEGADKRLAYKSLVDTVINLVPSNIIAALNAENIVGLVIFSALLGMAANRMEAKHPETIGVFKKLIHGLYQIVLSLAMTIIKYMPYAVTALLARTIITNGVPAIAAVSSFIVAIYLATALMLIVHLSIVALHGLSPVVFAKKAMETWLMAFSSRSSVGTLPMTISALTTRMGVNSGTANLVGSLGATMGMNGCAGFFPAMLAVMVAHMVGIEVSLSFYIMLVIVVTIGSIGIAGIPGSATVAATITLTGMGMGEHFALIAMILAVDPIIDMARTLANVSGTMTAAIATDAEVGSLDLVRFSAPDTPQTMPKDILR